MQLALNLQKQKTKPEVPAKLKLFSSLFPFQFFTISRRVIVLTFTKTTQKAEWLLFGKKQKAKLKNFAFQVSAI